MYIIIPSYEPDQKLNQLIRDLKAQNYDKILLVNDGSSHLYQPYFKEAESLGVTLLTHEVNKGKGAALKTAFAYLLEINYQGKLVTVDSDGQHLPKDIARVAQVLDKTASSLVLGSRAFTGKVPLRSRFGNRMTALFFKLATGQPVQDTQTGLRGFSHQMLPWLLTLEGDRFEYEFHMLLEAKQAGYDLVEVPIATVYLEDNKSSHFRPVRDSIRIYSPFIRFIGSAMAASVVDMTAFFILMLLTKELLVSVLLSRLVSSLVQCSINAKWVFKRESQPLRSFIRYLSLVLVILALNYFFMQSLISLGIGLLLAKLLTETSLFFLSYGVQNRYVYA